MTKAVTGFVIIVLLIALLFGLNYGFDATALILFVALVAVGALAIAVARAKDEGMAAPAQCAACGGLMSPNAPYCKHCGEPVPRI